MARPRTFDEGKVLDRAMDVFCRHGYEGTTMTDLRTAMGLTAPSVYAAFDSKRGLFEAVLDRYTDGQREHRAWVLAAPTAREVAERLLFRAADHLPNMGGPPGCLLVQGGLATGPDNADVPLALARRRQANELTLRDRFEQAKASGDLPPAADPAALASFVTTMFDGLSVRAAGGATVEELRKVVEQAMASWHARTIASEAVPTAPSTAIFSTSRSVANRGRPLEIDALGAAMEVFWRKGYEGASLTDLTEAMGITRPSLYATFGNKESLFLKALDRYQRENMAYVAKALEAPTARAVAEAIMVGAVSAQMSDCLPRGCLAVVNAMQGGDEAKAIRVEVLARAAATRALFVARFKLARDEGDLPASADPEGIARLLESVMQGIAIQGAAGASEEELHALASSALVTWPTRRNLPIDIVTA
jgi:TetR/AcrR family transcriptional regulator, copper-responsive repressor